MTPRRRAGDNTSLTTGPFLLQRLRRTSAAPDALIEALTKDGILTLADLELAFAEGRGLVADPSLRRFARVVAEEQIPLTLGRALDILDALMTELRDRVPDMAAIEPSGDVRRREAYPRGLMLVALAADPPRAIAAAAALPDLGVLYRSDRRLIGQYQGHEIDLRVAARDELGSLLFVTTGPAEHVAELQRRRGPRICATEADVYAQAGAGYLPPEVRDSPGVLDEALAGSFPTLVARSDIRGDLHLHTTYSDGRDSLREMVATCHALGYEYIAITDHSEHAAAFRTVDRDDLERQHDEIALLQDEFVGMTILRGIEADILADGRIDCDETTMASLDIVLASLHERYEDDRRRLTGRMLQAIRHPLVSVITHPQNQIVGHRDPYDLDYAAVYEAAAETGTILEIDGAPAHLDLDGLHSRDAIAHGVTVSIDSDCHRAVQLDRQMTLGIGIARRGRVEARHVLNTRPLQDVRAFIARKREA